MTRTTPPRPADLVTHFPELAQHSATATRLHPRPGTPTIADSSVGGPLLWPAGEPWPVCGEGDGHDTFSLSTPEAVRHTRTIYAAAEARAAATGEPYHLTDQEQAQLPDEDHDDLEELVDQPIPLVPVAQLYRRDVPDLPGPDGTDLLQVLWCPLDHPDEGYNPSVRLFWRRSADVTRPLAVAPEPPVVYDAYLPEVCEVHPEQVREYQYEGLLPEDLRSRITSWEEKSEQDYFGDLSLAPGWKVGGFANWSLTDPMPMDCAECGSAMTLLFTAASSEWGGLESSWKPVEEEPGAGSTPTGVTIGRGYSLYVFRCPVSYEHPPATAMQ